MPIHFNNDMPFNRLNCFTAAPYMFPFGVFKD